MTPSRHRSPLRIRRSPLDTPDDRQLGNLRQPCTHTPFGYVSSMAFGIVAKQQRRPGAVECMLEDGRDLRCLGQTPRLSVIIGTYNGARTIGATLAAFHQQVSAPPFEVIVVVDGSHDDTAEIAAAAGATVIALDQNQGHGHAVNIGIRAARAEIMATVDDDCIPPAAWVRDVLQAWQEVGSGVSVIGGAVVPHEVDTFNRRYVKYRRPLSPQEAPLDETAPLLRRFRYALAPPTPPPGRRAVFYAIGANLTARRSAILEIGGYAETPSTAGEEEYICRRLRAVYGPETVQFFPEIVMAHAYHASLADTFRRGRTYGRASGRRWAEQGGIPSIQPVPPISVGLSLAIALISPLAALVTLFVGPLFFYRRWLSSSSRSGMSESLAFPYVHFAEDVSTDMGFLSGWIRRRRELATAEASSNEAPS